MRLSADRGRGSTFRGDVLLSPSCPSARAQAPPDDGEIRIARLIRQLGSESYRDRFEAGDALEKIGPECRRALEAATLSDDAEIRLRAADLLKRFKADDLWLAGPGFLQQPRPAGFASAGDCRRAIGQSSHARRSPTARFTDAKVDLDYPAGQFWPVVDDICRQTGNQVRSDFEGHHRGAAIVAGSPGKFPTAYAGPLRAQITEEARNFSEKLHFADGRSEQSQQFRNRIERPLGRSISSGGGAQYAGSRRGDHRHGRSALRSRRPAETVGMSWAAPSGNSPRGSS